ncbi:flagella synthesis protein FlgN [Microbulbifer sp.]|uniref:flagella synthesis protein FlgN n=1 Tax=Microbulbifer sp. TaxID=1908541 RepID=UPI003F30372F
MTLAGHLEHHRAHLESLVELLCEERRLLAAGQVDGARLSQIAGRKSERLEELEHFERQRRRALCLLGYSDDRDGDERAAADAGCLPLWHAVRERAGRAADLNRTNGLLIGIRMEHNQRLLNALQETAGRDLYGPDGRPRGGSGRVNSRA